MNDPQLSIGRIEDTMLYPVFDYLRREKVPIGTAEYLVAIKAVFAGLGTDSLEHLEDLCRLLWTKSLEDQELLAFAFYHLVIQPLEQASVGKESEQKPTESNISTAEQQPTSNEEVLGNSKPEPSSSSGYHVPQEFARIPDATIEAVSELESAAVGQAQPTTTPVWRDWKLIFEEGDPEAMSGWRANINYHLSPQPSLRLRDMSTAWRHLRRMQRTGRKEELDVNGTLDDFCKNGLILLPRLVPRRRNRSDVLVLIDCLGSMTPFGLLSDTLVESIVRGGRLARVSVYYFHNYPNEFLYKDEKLSDKPLLVEQVLSTEGKGRSALIFSDGGAARGDYNPERVENTRQFLRILRNFTYLYAWLNPLPVTRWFSTTAEGIAGMIPMFPLNHDGLNDAVSIMRGQPFSANIDVNLSNT
jgi:uncharacterized protein with von Willebrand factor type A (vWA) domain